MDIAGLGENQRIKLIGNTCMTNPNSKIAFIVDNQPKKIDRYEKKLKHWFPQVTIERLGELTSGSFALRATFKVGQN